jgi:hypothetical protein
MSYCKPPYKFHNELSTITRSNIKYTLYVSGQWAPDRPPPSYKEWGDRNFCDPGDAAYVEVHSATVIEYDMLASELKLAKQEGKLLPLGLVELTDDELSQVEVNLLPNLEIPE